jgi:hypothetical protein
VRFSELRLRVTDSLIAPELERLYEELERRGLRFRPHVWLSTDWFSPDGIPGIAIPYYAAHPRLRRLERRMMGDVDGASRKWRLRLLRHEAGHAIDTAFRLRRRADWRAVFGPASTPYPKDYRVRPGSRDYVLHLGYWYAQSHPTEDFAETFAVWLQPRARWRRDYTGWPALAKLEYVDGLMQSLAGRTPPNRDRSIAAPLSDNSRTLGEHYRRRQRFYERIDHRYDDWIVATFPAGAHGSSGMPAQRFLRSMAPQLKRLLLRRTRVGQYLIEHALSLVIERAGELGLIATGTRRDIERRIAQLHERVISDVLHRNREHFML